MRRHGVQFFGAEGQMAQERQRISRPQRARVAKPALRPDRARGWLLRLLLIVKSRPARTGSLARTARLLGKACGRGRRPRPRRCRAAGHPPRPRLCLRRLSCIALRRHFRLAGRHLINLMGNGGARGMPVCFFMNTSSRGRLSDVLESVFRGPQIAEMRNGHTPPMASPGFRPQMLLLPLRSDLGDVTRALGCLIAEGEIGQNPRRFDLTTATMSVGHSRRQGA